MEKRESKSVIGNLRNCSWSKLLLFILVINFINLSANFYEGNISISRKIKLDDPIDTLSELIFEWALDGSDELIPDNGTHQDDNSLEKIKLTLIEIPGFIFTSTLEINLTLDTPFLMNITSGHPTSDTPPPDRC
jgi:hypothetical protein